MKGATQVQVVNGLKRALEHQGMTQGQLARLIGRAKPQVCAMVNDTDPNPGIRLVLEIAAALNVDPGTLYSLPGDLARTAANGQG